jgi:hypothetical protein
MWGVTRGTEGGVRRGLGSALIAGVGVSLCLMASGGFQGTVSVMECVGVAVGLAAVVLVCGMLAGRRGFVLIWVLLLGAWLFSVVTDGAAPLPERFTIWSTIALPLSLSTEFFGFADHSRPVSRRFVLVGSVWIVLILGSAHLARYAPDVGMTPRQHPLIRLLVPLLLLPTPPILSLWMIRRASKTVAVPVEAASL